MDLKFGMVIFMGWGFIQILASIFDQPVVALTSGIVAFLLYAAGWWLDGAE